MLYAYVKTTPYFATRLADDIFMPEWCEVLRPCMLLQVVFNATGLLSTCESVQTWHSPCSASLSLDIAVARHCFQVFQFTSGVWLTRDQVLVSVYTYWLSLWAACTVCEVPDLQIMLVVPAGKKSGCR